MAVRIQLNRAGGKELLRSPPVMKMLESEARKRQTHPDIEMESFRGRNRNRVTLRSQTIPGRAALKQAFGQ